MSRFQSANAQYAPLPGSFVVMQGIPGDGLANTMDRLPELAPPPHESAAAALRLLFPLPLVSSVLPPARSASTKSQDDFVVVSDDTANSRQHECADEPWLGASQHSAYANDDAHLDYQALVSPVDSARLSQPDDNTTNTNMTATDTQQELLLKDWTNDSRLQEVFQWQEWNESLCHTNNTNNTVSSPLPTTPTCWWACPTTGWLAVFSSPALDQVTHHLAPGTTCVACERVVVSSDVLLPPFLRDELSTTTISSIQQLQPHQLLTNHLQTMCHLKIESPVSGWVVASMNNYPFVAHGLPEAYVDPNIWYWRVTCPAGAFVRGGLELHSDHTATLPRGSLVRVTRKAVNAMGLSRLQVMAFVDPVDSDDANTYDCNDDSDPKAVVVGQQRIEGWCSEFLNPLSGQRGAVLLPVPFPCPVVYRVILKTGAVIRSGVELSSSEIGVAPYGALLTVTGRSFSEHPKDSCIERLRLAGNGGWISCRLNKRPPEKLMVVEFVQLDGSFEPEHAGRFHVEAMRRVQREQQSELTRDSGTRADSNESDGCPPDSTSLAETSENERSSPQSKTTDSSATTQAHYSVAACQRLNRKDDKCLICLSEERTATLVHGESGHIACCLVCARILKARKDPCPVCRIPIDSVIQHFWA
jgi:hypothetical protein